MARLKSVLLAAGAAAAYGLATQAALAQDPSADPVYGQESLGAGFGEPLRVGVQAGGAIEAGDLAPECSGYISYWPSFALDYEAGDEALFISAASDADAVLAVQTPGGEIVCDDDGALGTNPGLRFDSPESGRYAIWVGTWGTVGYQPAMLHISEDGFSSENIYSRAPDPDAAPSFGSVRYRAGAEARTAVIEAGGEVEAELATDDDYCPGYVSESPDLRLDYDGSGGALFLAMRAEFDGTLAVRGPDGSWYCDDDEAGDLNPGVRINSAMDGDYLIWGGSFGGGSRQSAELVISDLGFFGVEPAALDWAAPPEFGAVELAAGFTPDPTNIPVMAGGPAEAAMSTDNQCYGFTTEAPSVDLYYEAGDLDLYLSASSAGDATLIVNAPDGSWWCDDDSAGDLNPGVRFDAPESGLYNIWVGSYGEYETMPATLHISELAFLDPWGETGLDYEAEPNFGRTSLSTGFSPDPHLVPLSAGGAMAAADTVDHFCSGYVTEAPDYVVSYQAGPDDALYFGARSEHDTTLVVRKPDGEWVCNDDGGEGYNPALGVMGAQSGEYAIWVGTYSPGPAREAELSISATGHAGGPMPACSDPRGC